MAGFGQWIHFVFTTRRCCAARMSVLRRLRGMSFILYPCNSKRNSFPIPVAFRCSHLSRAAPHHSLSSQQFRERLRISPFSSSSKSRTAVSALPLQKQGAVGSEAVLLPAIGVYPAQQVDEQRIRQAAARLGKEGQILGQMYGEVKLRYGDLILRRLFRLLRIPQVGEGQSAPWNPEPL